MSRLCAVQHDGCRRRLYTPCGSVQSGKGKWLAKFDRVDSNALGVTFRKTYRFDERRRFNPGISDESRDYIEK
jgi:hypothetical protein